jgi:hypothetical protein
MLENILMILLKVFFKQGGMEIPMTLARQNETIKPLNRPQTPKAPFITLPKKLVFKTSIDKNTLAGTLSIPKILQKFHFSYDYRFRFTKSR